MANSAPITNRTREETTKGMANRRSRGIRPGVTNIQASYRTTGRARANPVKTATFSLTRNGSNTL